MRIPIFNLNNSNNYKDEYFKMIKIFQTKCITFDKKEYTYFDFINKEVFHNWKYRGTYLDCYLYLESIGVHLKQKKITKEGFINLLEFILNIQLLINNIKYYSDKTKYSVKCKSIIVHNIPILLDQLGYQAFSLDDRIILCEKDISYENLGDIVPDDIFDLLLSYKNVNNSGIKMKRIILNKLYNYLNNNSDKYKSYSSPIFNVIKLVVTKMGVDGEIDKKFEDLSNYKLRKYYDDCYYMIIYLIETENILKYKDEIRSEY